jgi:alcohol dehydrogenase, propanol-preferring
VGRIIVVGPETELPTGVGIGALVGIRFLSRVCHECEYCKTGREQHCPKGVNHLHHEDGSFLEYCILDTDYLTVLPQDIDPKVVGPVLCAGVTTFKAVKNANVNPGEWLCVIGAGGGLGHLAGKIARILASLLIYQSSTIRASSRSQGARYRCW